MFKNKINIFFTADLHMGHTNLIKNGVRHFKDCQEHDETIITNWNNVVKKQDLIYIAGDCVWGGDFSLLSCLNGQKIVIKGNHDKKHDLNKAKSSNIINNWHYLKGITYKDNYIFMCHYPMLSWDRAFHESYCAFGHTHNTLEITKGRSMDVGVDANNFTPIHIDDFINKLKYRSNKYFYNKNGVKTDI